jgi:hypothetical protein
MQAIQDFRCAILTFPSGYHEEISGLVVALGETLGAGRATFRDFTISHHYTATRPKRRTVLQGFICQLGARFVRNVYKAWNDKDFTSFLERKLPCCIPFFAMLRTYSTRQFRSLKSS